MQKDAKIVSRNREPRADFVLIHVLEKNGAKDGTVAFWKLREDIPNDLPGFGRDGEFFQIENFVWDFGMRGIERDISGTRAVVLEENVVANGIHEGAQPIALANTPVGTQRTKDAAEGFLTEVVDNFGREVTSTKL